MRDCPECDTNIPVDDLDIVFCPNCHAINWFCNKEPQEDRPQYCHKCGWKLYGETYWKKKGIREKNPL